MSDDTKRPPAWAPDEVRAMSPGDRLTAVLLWALSVYEILAKSHDVESENPHFIMEMTAIAVSVAKQTALILSGDIDGAYAIHEETDRLIASWSWSADVEAPETKQ